MKKGITSNILKIIAILFMIIDHIGLYFYNNLNDSTYYAFRNMGRIAMPMFVYIIIQGFFYTKNLKKYIFRVFILATTTQIILFILGYINQLYYPSYYMGINRYLGVLYSYCLSLILLMIIDRKVIIRKLDENKNLIVRINIFILILLAYMKLRIEFDWTIPFLFLELYGIEKLFQRDNELLLKQTFENKIRQFKNNSIYLFLIFIAILLSTCFIEYSPGNKYAMLLSVVFIGMYTGKRGKINKLIQFTFYMVFPLQHFVLYLLGMMQ